MGLFGKPRMSEIEAAGTFVFTLAGTAKREWPAISSELDKLCGLSGGRFVTAEYADFEFTLAALSVQLQALPNLLPASQAGRIREHVLRAISTPELESYPRETVQEYQVAWDSALAGSELPYEAVASLLCDKLGCASTVEVGGRTFKNPFLVMALSEKVVTFCGAWWKNLISSNKLVQ